MTGARYIESLRDGREVWLDGKKVDDVTTHPAFRDMINALARRLRPAEQRRVPRRDDVRRARERRAHQPLLAAAQGPRGLRTASAATASCWNMLTWGQLGRSPDILAPYISNMVPRAETSSASFKNPNCDFGENIVNYYKYCRDNDLFLTHALGDPQVDRSTQPQNERRAVPEDEEIALHVVEETAEGVIVTRRQAALDRRRAQQRVLRLAVGDLLRPQRPALRPGLLHPTATRKGLKILAREPVGRWFGSWGHPLQDLDEQDCMLFFDNVLIPWDRLFFLYESPARVMTIARPRRRRHQLRRLGQPGALPVPLPPAHGRRDDGRRGGRRHRVPRGRVEARRDGDELRDAAPGHGRLRALEHADGRQRARSASGWRRPPGA